MDKKEEIKLRVDYGDELFVPVALLDPKFTPTDIAVILVFMAMANGHMAATNEYLLKHELTQAAKALQERKVIALSTDQGALKITIDLESNETNPT